MSSAHYLILTSKNLDLWPALDQSWNSAKYGFKIIEKSNISWNHAWRQNLCLIHTPDKLDRQSEVGYTAGPISFHQYVLTLQIPVSNGRFALGAKDLGVEVTKAGQRGVGQPQHGLVVQSGWFQVVVQRAIFMVVRDQVELGPGASSFNICRDETYEWRQSKELNSVIFYSFFFFFMIYPHYLKPR